jgi:hypothetical protein
MGFFQLPPCRSCAKGKVRCQVGPAWACLPCFKAKRRCTVTARMQAAGMKVRPSNNRPRSKSRARSASKPPISAEGRGRKPAKTTPAGPTKSSMKSMAVEPKVPTRSSSRRRSSTPATNRVSSDTRNASHRKCCCSCCYPSLKYAYSQTVRFL